MKTQFSVLITLGIFVLTSSAQSTSSSSASQDETVQNYINQGQENAQKLTCYVRSGLKFFDLTPLMKNGSDYILRSTMSQYAYSFNFCKYAYNPCDDKSSQSYAFQRGREGLSTQYCYAMTDDTWIADSARYNEAYESNNQSYPAKLLYTLSGGSEEGDCDGTPRQLTFEITCNKNQTGDPVFSNLAVNDRDVCNVQISIEHESGCPDADLNQYYSFMTDNPWVLAILFIFFGPILNFFGRKFVPWVIGVVSGLFTFTLLIIFFQFIGMLDYFNSEKEGNGFVAFLAILIATFVAIIVGYLMKTKFLSFGFIILGAVAGFFLGGLIYNVFMIEWANSLGAMWGTIIFCMIVGAFLGHYMKEHIVIVSTSFLGSYLFVRGFSIFFGGYPTETDMMNQIETNTASFTPAMIGYLVAMGLFFVLGVIYQYKQKKHDEFDGGFKHHH